MTNVMDRNQAPCRKDKINDLVKKYKDMLLGAVVVMPKTWAKSSLLLPSDITSVDEKLLINKLIRKLLRKKANTNVKVVWR